MANSKLIIVEGPQGAGKTTVTDYLRNKLPYTNLYRLCGTSDQGYTGKNKAAGMYMSLLDYIKTLENKSINLVFDRTFFTEQVYCTMGKKDYDFTEFYQLFCDKLFEMDFEIYYITLFMSNPESYAARLDRPGKANFKNSVFSGENSFMQQIEYGQMLSALVEAYGNKENVNFYSLDTDRTKKEIFQDLDNLFNLN